MNAIANHNCLTCGSSCGRWTYCYVHAKTQPEFGGDVMLEHNAQLQAAAKGHTYVSPYHLVQRPPLARSMNRPLTKPGKLHAEKGLPLEPKDYRWLDSEWGEGFTILLDHAIVPKSMVSRKCKMCYATFYLETYPIFVDWSAYDHNLPKQVIDDGRLYHRMLVRCDACRPKRSISNKLARKIAEFLWGRGIKVVKGSPSTDTDGVKEIAWRDVYRGAIDLTHADEGLQLSLKMALEDRRKPYEYLDTYERPDMDALGCLRDPSTNAEVFERKLDVEFNDDGQPMDDESLFNSDGVHHTHSDLLLTSSIVRESRLLEQRTLRENQQDDSQAATEFLQQHGIH